MIDIYLFDKKKAHRKGTTTFAGALSATVAARYQSSIKLY